MTIVDASRKHSRASRRYSPARCSFPLEYYAALKEARTLTVSKNSKNILEPISLVRVATNQDRGGNHVADPCLNSSGFRYHIEYSRLMALRVVREEGARKLEHERRPLGTLLTGTRPWNQSPPFAFWGAAVGGRFMIRTKVEEYRQHAQECLQLAGMITAREHRAVLVAWPRTAKLIFSVVSPVVSAP